MMTMDIFDRIMEWRVLRPFRPFYKKYKEQLLYLLFGGLTTVVSIGVFALFTEAIPLDELVANILSWIFAVLFAFVTNRTWVFQGAKTENLWKQMLTFYAGRLATLLVEELMLLVLVKWLLLNAMAVKLAAQVVIVILNYVISKLFIFRKQ